MEDASEPPDLVYPYFEDPVEAAEEIARAQARFAEMEAGWIDAVWGKPAAPT
jgi:hypothetical protein